MPQSEQARATRTALLDAAEIAFAERGFHDTKLRDVARNVGVTQPLIHHYFKTKDALFDAVVIRVLERYEAAQFDQWNRDGSDVRFFTQGIRTLFEFLGRHRRVARLMRWASLEGRLPEIPQGNELDARVREKFVGAQQAGVLHPNVSVDAARLMIDAVTRGFWDRADQMPALKQQADDIIDELLRCLLVSVLSEKALAEALEILDQPDHDERNEGNAT
ncbi:MAG: TetR/AcrR family transcriptional regulator [Myxococcota bacterium]